MSILLTQEAIDKIEQQIKDRGKGLGIRLGVKTTGCSGLAYVLEFVDEANAQDEAVDSGSFKVYVNPKDRMYLDGTQLHYSQTELEEGFEFKNPNVKGSCGCGESFTV
jgi:iron-sulfur cluster assembly protein